MPETEEKRTLMTSMSRIVPCLLAAMLVMAAGEPPAGDVVAQRGEVRMTAADLKDALGLLEPGVRAQVMATPQALANFARERMLNLSALAEAKAKGWDTNAEVARRGAEARDAVVLQSYLASVVPPDPLFPSEADVTQAYENNKTRLIVPKQLHVAQIVLLVKAGASAQEDEETRKKILDLRTQALKPKADFADLARKHSQEQPSGENGGEVGWLREPDMLQPVREAVANLADGGISQPVRIPDGWHIIKLLATKPAGPVPLIDAKPQIVQALRQARAQRMTRAYLDEMAKTLPIQVNEIELTKAGAAAK